MCHLHCRQLRYYHRPRWVGDVEVGPRQRSSRLSNACLLVPYMWLYKGGHSCSPVIGFLMLVEVFATWKVTWIGWRDPDPPRTKWKAGRLPWAQTGIERRPSLPKMVFRSPWPCSCTDRLWRDRTERMRLSSRCTWELAPCCCMWRDIEALALTYGILTIISSPWPQCLKFTWDLHVLTGLRATRDSNSFMPFSAVSGIPNPCQ